MGRYGKCHTSHTIPKRTCLRNPNFKAEFSQVLDVSRGVIARISHDFPSRWEIHRPPWPFLNFPLKQSKWGFLYYLVGGLEHEFYDFPHTVNVIIPTDFNSIIFQRGWLKPPTSYGFLWTYPMYIYIYYMINFPIPAYGIRPRPWPWPRNDSSALVERAVERHEWRPFAHLSI